LKYSIFVYNICSKEAKVLMRREYISVFISSLVMVDGPKTGGSRVSIFNCDTHIQLYNFLDSLIINFGKAGFIN